MLADDLIALAGSRDDKLMCGAFTAMAGRLREAQHFDLSPEIMQSAYTIAHSPIGAQLRALPLCKLPFRVTWVEWPGGFAGIDSTRDDDAPIPKRMGALVECDDSLQRGRIVYAWVHRNGMGNVCPLAITFDWREVPEPLEDITHMSTWDQRATDAEWRELQARFERVRVSKREDFVADNMRFGVVFNDMLDKFMAVASVHTPAGLNKVLKAAALDIEGEAPLLRAAFMLMNSRNLAEFVDRRAPPKLNRARVKSGKAPMLDFSHVTIRLTRTLAARAGMAADPRQPSRLHLVRGHFKIRSSGVYWWSPHPRGVGDGRPLFQRRHVVT